MKLFLHMHCDVYYYPAKFKIQIQIVHGETKKINSISVSAHLECHGILLISPASRNSQCIAFPTAHLSVHRLAAMLHGLVALSPCSSTFGSVSSHSGRWMFSFATVKHASSKNIYHCVAL